MSAETTILVTFAAIEEAEHDIVVTAGELGGELADLHGYLAPLVSTWGGAAAGRYDALQRQWDRAAADLAHVLALISRVLAAAAENYRHAEIANAGRWRG